MQKRKYLLSTTLILLCMSSCIKDKPLQFEEYVANKDVPFFDTIDHPAASLSWTLQLPKGTDARASFLTKSLIQIICDTVCECQNMDEAIELYSKNYRASYQSDNAFLLKAEEPVSKRMLELLDGNYEEFSMSSSLNTTALFSCIIAKNSYSGGAHGILEEKGYIFDLKEKKQLSYSDIFIKSDSLQSLIIENLMKQYGKEQYEDLSYFGFFDLTDFTVTDNIILTEQGVTWIFNPYEIAAYSAGIIKVTLPYNSLKPFMNPKSAIHRLF